MSRQKHRNQCSLKILKNFRPLFYGASNSRFPPHQRPISGDKLNNVMVRSSVYIYIYREVWNYTINVNKIDTGKFLECRETASFYGANGTVLNIPCKFIITFLSSACMHTLQTYFQSAECSPVPLLLYSSFTRVLSPCGLIFMCWGQAGLNQREQERHRRLPGMQRDCELLWCQWNSPEYYR